MLDKLLMDMEKQNIQANSMTKEKHNIKPATNAKLMKCKFSRQVVICCKFLKLMVTFKPASNRP